MILISEEQVRETVSMSQAVDLVEQMLIRLEHKGAVNHPRRRVVMDNRTLLHYMAGGDNENKRVGIKVYATNPAVGAPNFVVLLYDSETAKLLAVIDANTLGQIRTGAASGVATKHLSQESASRLALFGSGYQAETQLEAIACVRALKAVKVYSRNPEKRSSFANRMKEKLELPIQAVDSAEEALDGADIVTTITNAREPVFDGDLLTNGVHINAAGSNQSRRNEIDSTTIKRSSLITVDSLIQSQMEAGDLIQAAKEGLLDWNNVIELSTVLSGKQPGRTSREQITLFESQGLAVEDIALADFTYQNIAQ